MKKVFLSFVGERDPYAISKEGKKSDGSILSLCEEIKPDYVFLFPSGKNGNPERNTEERGEQAKKILEERNPALCSENGDGLAGVTVMPLDVKDATDFEALSRTFNDRIDKILGILDDPSKYEYHLNCSSGTPQMSALGYVFANSGRIPDMKRWQCKDPAVAKKNEEKRNRTINTTFLEENAYRKRVEIAANFLNFPVIVDNCRALSKIASTPRQVAICEFLANLFSAYDKMDILCYGEACASLSAACEKWRDLVMKGTVNDEDKQYSDLIHRQLTTLNELAGANDKETVKNLTDLYFNMQRCLTRGAFADVLARFRRVVEGCLYYRLNNLGILPRDLSHSPNRENLQLLRNHFGTLGRYFELEEAKEALFEALPYSRDYFQPTEEFQTAQSVLDYFNGKVRELNEIRNKTIIAHGMEPVRKNDADESLTCAKSILCTLVRGTREFILAPDPQDRKTENYPFSRRNIRKWVKLL